MKTLRRIFLLPAFLTLFACSGASLRVESEALQPFPAHRTYALKFPMYATGTEIFPIHHAIQKEMIDVSQKELSREGFEEVPTESAELLIQLRMAGSWDPRVDNDKKRSLQGLSGSNFPDPNPRTRTYQQRKIIVEAVSPDGKTAYWRGSADGVQIETIDGGASQVEAVRRLVHQLAGE